MSDFKSRSKDVYIKQVMLYNEIQTAQSLKTCGIFPFRSSGQKHKSSKFDASELDLSNFQSRLFKELHFYGTKHFKLNQSSLLYVKLFEWEHGGREQFYYDVLSEYDNYDVLTVKDPEFWYATQEMTMPDMPVELVQTCLQKVCQDFIEETSPVHVSFKRTVRDLNMNQVLKSDTGSLLALIYLLHSLECFELKPEFAEDELNILISINFLPLPFANKVAFLRMLFAPEKHHSSSANPSVIGNGPPRKRKFTEMMLVGIVGMMSLASGLNASINMPQVSANSELELKSEIINISESLQFHPNSEISTEDQLIVSQRFKKFGLTENSFIQQMIGVDLKSEFVQVILSDDNTRHINSFRMELSKHNLLQILRTKARDDARLLHYSPTRIFEMDGSQNKVMSMIDSLYGLPRVQKSL